MNGVRHHAATRVVLLAWLWCWAAGAVTAQAASPLPASPKPHYIRDDAKWLSPAAYQALDAKLKAYEQESSSEFVVAIFPNIPDGAEMVDFSQRLFEAWKPGGAAKDNGAIFLIFAAERKMRIHTGYGMEGVLPDARCKQIIQDRVAPLLRQGQREAAINAGVDAMIAAAKGEYTGTGKTRLDGKTHGNPLVWPPLLVFILLFIVFRMLPRALSRSYGGGWSGGGFSGGGWSGGGGGFSGGGDSGGGFSGGGGDSGGGGASGSW